MRNDVFLRDYRETDFEAIASLMGEIYPPEVVNNSRGHWRWQYHDNPRNANDGVAIRVAERDGAVVATLCGLRQRFWLDGKTIPGLWVVDFMARQAGTDQKERLRFGQRLAIELRETQPLVAGVNRPALNRYWKRILGDQIDICALPMLLRPLRMRALARHKIANPVLAEIAAAGASLALPFKYRTRRRGSGELSFEESASFDARFDRFWEEVAPSFRNICVRDAAYLEWRYRKIPDRRYRCAVVSSGGHLRGWVVTREVHDGELRKTRIVDLLARSDDREAWGALVGGVMARAAGEGADLVHTLDSTVPALHEAFHDAGLRPNPDATRVSQYIAFTKSPGLDLDEFYRGENWFVTLGDSDTDFATPA